MVEDKDYGYLDAVKDINGLALKEVVAGVFGERAEIAYRNEYGTERIPQRAFLRTAFDNHVDEVIDKYAESVAKDGNCCDNLQFIADNMAERVKESIKSGNWTPNAPSTVRRKGKNTPLIDTGKMLDSVKGEVR